MEGVIVFDWERDTTAAEGDADRVADAEWLIGTIEALFDIDVDVELLRLEPRRRWVSVGSVELLLVKDCNDVGVVVRDDDDEKELVRGREGDAVADRECEGLPKLNDTDSVIE